MSEPEKKGTEQAQNSPEQPKKRKKQAYDTFPVSPIKKKMREKGRSVSKNAVKEMQKALINILETLTDEAYEYTTTARRRVIQARDVKSAIKKIKI